MMVYPSSLHRRREVTRMRRALASAEAIVMSTPEAALQVRRHFPELAEKLIVAIPNGFDATDFDGPVPERRDGKFRIVHTGYLHTELGRRQRQTAFAHWLLGGEIRGVDILTRSHIYLLEAIERLIEREPALASTIEVHLAGVLSREDREVAERSSVVRMLGYLPHADSVALLRSADLLFLPMQNLPRGKRATIVPGKTYEYLASGRPILAAVPDGDARDILSAAGNCRFTSPDDSAAIADEIAAEIDRWSAGRGIREPAPEVVRRYERRFLTAELAALMDAVTALPTADRLQPARGISPTRVPSRVTQSSVEA
jgi:glycosyltransferase involved in cell wall biosynthesis